MGTDERTLQIGRPSGVGPCPGNEQILNGALLNRPQARDTGRKRQGGVVLSKN